MMKTKRFLLVAATAALALAFSACSDDSSSSGSIGACYTELDFLSAGSATCLEYPDGYPDDEAKDACDEAGGEWRSSCPSGEAEKCDYAGATWYNYGDAANTPGLSCQ